MDSADPEPADDPWQPLTQELQRLWRRRGQPATREVAKRCGGRVSHTTVHQLLRGRTNGRWETVERIADALGGDLELVRALWDTAAEAAFARNVMQKGQARLPPLQPDGRANRTTAINNLAEAINNLAEAIKSGGCDGRPLDYGMGGARADAATGPPP